MIKYNQLFRIISFKNKIWAISLLFYFMILYIYCKNLFFFCADKYLIAVISLGGKKNFNMDAMMTERQDRFSQSKYFYDSFLLNY